MFKYPRPDIDKAYRQSQEIQGQTIEKPTFLDSNKNTYFLANLLQKYFNTITSINETRPVILGMDGLIFRLNLPPVRTSSTVLMLEIADSNGTALEKFVIKLDNTDTIKKYFDEYSNYPLRKKYMPKILAKFKHNSQLSWAVYENLQGLHDTELENQVYSNQVLFENYFKCSITLIDDIALNPNYRLFDVDLLEGHNIFLTDQGIKLVEQDNLIFRPDSYLYENVCEVLRDCLSYYTRYYGNDGSAEKKLEFVYNLCKHLLGKVDHLNLFVREFSSSPFSATNEFLYMLVWSDDSNLSPDVIEKLTIQLHDEIHDQNSDIAKRFCSFIEELKSSPLAELPRLYQSEQGKEFLKYSQLKNSWRFPIQLSSLILSGDFGSFKKLVLEDNNTFRTIFEEGFVTDPNDPIYYGRLD